MPVHTKRKVTLYTLLKLSIVQGNKCKAFPRAQLIVPATAVNICFFLFKNSKNLILVQIERYSVVLDMQIIVSNFFKKGNKV